MARRLPGWLAAPIVGAGFITLYAGAAQFGVTAVLGDVAVAFDVVTSAEVEGSVGMSAGTLGLALAVIRFAGMGALFGSVIADRLGRRTVLLGASAIGLTITGVATFMPTFWAFVLLLALGRPLLTTTNAVVSVVASEEAATEDRTAAIAFMSAAYAVGSGLVSVLRSLGDGFGYRTVLLGSAAMVFTLPLVGRLVRNSPAAERHAGDLDRPRFGLVDRPYVRPLVVLCVLAALTNLVTGPALTWLFVFGEQVLGESPGEMAQLVLLAGPTGLAGLLAGRWAGDRIGRRTTAALGTAAAPLAAIWTYSGDEVALRVGYLTMIFALAFLGPPVGALLNEVMPTDTRATANGWVGATAVVGGVAGLIGFGMLIDAMPSYRAAAMWLFLPAAPLALGYFFVPDEPDPDIAEIDRLVHAEHGVAVTPDDLDRSDRD